MKNVKGYFSELKGEKGQFYKIENYDCMEDFFMTITSSSDIWNFCWAQGGITAGRIDCDHAIFPYYTADKVSDAKSYTGAYTSILIEKEEPILWEPFSSLSASPAIRKSVEKNLTRNIYKNTAGTEIWFEEINNELNLSFRYGWTSSTKYGLVRKSVITNLSNKNVSLKILDGCRNILPACVDADFQNNNSVLLDAYKKTDLDEKSNLAIFAVSSIVTDKAEPSEGLFANTCWFSTDDKILLNPDAPIQFAENGKVEEILVVKGKRPAAYICKSINFSSEGDSSEWYQVFETNLDAGKIAQLKSELADKNDLVKNLEKEAEKIKEISGVNPLKCMKCGKCSATCPSFDEMDIKPHQFVSYVVNEDIEALTNSKSLWKCLSCFACVERCPRDVKPAKLIDAARQIVVRQKDQDYLSPNEIPELLDPELPQQLLVSAFRRYRR